MVYGNFNRGIAVGRDLKRVPLDFDWTLAKVWTGYLNPYYAKQHRCVECNDGSGLSPTAQYLHELWYGYVPFKPEDRGLQPYLPTDDVVLNFAKRNVEHASEFYNTHNWEFKGTTVEREAQRLAENFNEKWCYHLNQSDIDILFAAGKLKDYTHTFVPGKGWEEKPNFVIPPPRQVSEDAIHHVGGSFQWTLMKAECKRLGVDHECAGCKGEGYLWECEEDKIAFDEWRATEPPEGDGYQVWENVSEGSPISPVFASPEELAAHMATTRWGADTGTSYETWMNFILGTGWAPTGMTVGGVAVTGVEGLVLLQNQSND